ncbi:MAG: 3-hydroxyacyl-CoA dehydrogenase family protein [Thermoplasmata archaeon]|nr:3-hydroxyacyl-CoA dehydrogenase family protein [Thermoplasmata archaeon]
MGAAGPDAAGTDPRLLSRTRVFVVGAGIMGSGIAAQCALSGYAVTLADLTDELAERGVAGAKRALDSAVRKGRVKESEREEAVARIEPAIGYRRAAAAPILIEAVPEKLELKHEVFRELDRAASPHALLASNTSSLPITSIAKVVKDPGRVVGIHFFNPVLSMALVEVIPGHATRPEVVEGAVELARSLGKTVVKSRDTPGFVTSRAVAVAMNEAVWMLYEGVATKEDIDAGYRLGFGHPMGPFELLDLVGLDTALSILDVLWDGYRDSKYRACPLLRTLVEAGKLGRKTGEGFYSYPQPPGETRPT